MQEAWKPIPGYEGFYEASTLGRIRSVSRLVRCYGGHRTIRLKVLQHCYGPKGYPVVSISKGTGEQLTIAVHVLVLLTFRGPRPEGLLSRHLDGVKWNCSLDNLVYGTDIENWADRVKHQEAQNAL